MRRLNPIVIAVLAIASGASADTTNWPQFRGPRSDGLAEGASLPDRWTTKENVVWKIDVPGWGWSSPVVWDDKVFLTSAVVDPPVPTPKVGGYPGGNVKPGDVHRWVVYCLDRKTGKLLWEREVHKGVPPQRVVLLPNWVDLAAITPMSGPNGVRAELGIGENTTLLLYAGNMGEKQGLDVVIAAARRLEGEPGLLFLMVGTGAALCRLQAAAQGLPNMVWWPLQPLHRLNELLNAADIHLLPQRGDAADLVMPSKLGGMLASGRLVIGTARDDTELGRVLDATGVRIDPGQPALLAEAISRLAADPPQRATLGAVGRRHAELTLDITPVLQLFVRSAAALRTAGEPHP